MVLLTHTLKTPQVGMPEAMVMQRAAAAGVDPDFVTAALIAAGLADDQSAPAVADRAAAAPGFLELCDRSAALPYDFPTKANKVAEICGGDCDLQVEAVAMAAGVRPVIHEDVVPLIEDFLRIKRELGTAAERAVYADVGGVAGLVDRLVRRRPLMFMMDVDLYLLPSGENGAGAEVRGGRGASGRVWCRSRSLL